MVHGERIEIKEEEVICKNEPNLDFKKKLLELLGDIRDSDQQIVSQHAANKPFKCDICNYTFTQKGHMKIHIKSVHGNKKSFKCDICDNSYSIKSVLKRHIDSVHEKKKSSPKKVT